MLPYFFIFLRFCDVICLSVGLDNSSSIIGDGLSERVAY